jgi:hypothetical protein
VKRVFQTTTMTSSIVVIVLMTSNLDQMWASQEEIATRLDVRMVTGGL